MAQAVPRPRPSKISGLALLPPPGRGKPAGRRAFRPIGGSDTIPAKEIPWRRATSSWWATSRSWRCRTACWSSTSATSSRPIPEAEWSRTPRSSPPSTQGPLQSGLVPHPLVRAHDPRRHGPRSAPGRHPDVPWGELLRDFSANGVRPDQVDMVVMTHLHRDHVGGAHARPHVGARQHPRHLAGPARAGALPQRQPVERRPVHGQPRAEVRVDGQSTMRRPQVAT